MIKITQSINSRALDVISAEDNVKINEFIDEVEDIFKNEISKSQLDRLIEDQRAKVFRDIETQYDYYGTLDLDFILERRMKMLIATSRYREKNEEVFILEFNKLKSPGKFLKSFGNMFKSTGRSFKSLGGSIKSKTKKDPNEEEHILIFPQEALSGLNTNVILEIDDPTIKSYYNLKNRLIRRSTVIIALLQILLSIIILRLDNVSISVYEKYARLLYIENTEKYTRTRMIYILLGLEIALSGLLFLILIFGIMIWLNRLRSKSVVRHLYLIKNINIPYNTLMTPPQGINTKKYTKTISYLLFNNFISIKSGTDKNPEVSI